MAPNESRDIFNRRGSKYMCGEGKQRAFLRPFQLQATEENKKEERRKSEAATGQPTPSHFFSTLANFRRSPDSRDSSTTPPSLSCCPLERDSSMGAYVS